MNTDYQIDLSFRPAQQSDLITIGAFATSADELFYVHPTAKFPLTAEQLLPNFQNRKGNTVVEVDGKVAGFANYISVIENDSATIGNVIINPALRGKGIGKALLMEMERKAAQEYGAQHTIIPCFNTNTYGLHFYHSLGYVPFKGEPRTDHKGETIFLIYLKKTLS